MKKLLTTLTLLLTLCSFVKAQENYYFDEPITSTSVMLIGFSTVYIDGIQQTDQNDIEIAAFINDQVRGRIKGISTLSNYYYVSFPVSGSGSDEDGLNIVFKGYNHDTDEELPATTMCVYSDRATLGSPEEPFEIHFTSPSIAQIGNTKYSTLTAAVEAAESGQTITILRDATAEGVVINKSLIIDFGGFTYTFTTPAVGSTGTESNGFQILNGNTVTLQNGTLNVAEANKNDYYILIQNYANLNVINMTLDGTNLDKWIEQYSDSYVLSNNSGNVNISNSTITANNDGTKSFAFDVCKNASYEAPVVTLGENVVVNGKVELSGGQLVHSQELTALVKKTFTGGQAWGTLSVPIVGGAAIPNAAAGTHDLYRYDEKDQQWEYYAGNNASNPYTTLDLGKGYLYTNTNTITLSFEGELNTAAVTLPLSYTEANTLAGFNMVGNPFTHSITEANFALSDNEAQLANGFYIVNASGALEAKTADTKIAPMEAVLVKSNKTAKLTINKNVTSKRSVEECSYLAINVANATSADVAYVSFGEGLGLDKIAHQNSEIPMVYVPVDGTDYAIAMMDKEVTEVPVSFKASVFGEYTISVSSKNCEFDNMYLVDRMTGERTNLNTDSYTFVATSNDNADRFVITMSNDGEYETENFAFFNNGEIVINDIEGNGVVRILDVMGRPVAEYNVIESANIATDAFVSGVYMIQMYDNNGVKVQKVVIE